MPITASLSDDRAKSPLAFCGELLEFKAWHNKPWVFRKDWCAKCPLRFNRQASCSLDVITIGEIGDLKNDLQECLRYLATNPGWEHFDGSIHETGYAYRKLKLEVPTPKLVIERFFQSCVEIKKDDEFWKEWNYQMVEGFEARPVKDDGQGPMHAAAHKLITNLTEPITYSGERLYLLHAASSIFEDAAELMVEWDDCGNVAGVLPKAFGSIAEACRRAMMAGASLEIS